MIYWYTARGVFNITCGAQAWENYIQWIQLPQLVEVVSLDGGLNEDIISEKSHYVPDSAVIDNDFITGLYTSLKFVSDEMKDFGKYNLLAVIKNPTVECNTVNLNDFDFVGYDLLDQDYGNSALTNCGGFYETYSPADINQFGLMDDFEKAIHTKELLITNNPVEHHADTNLFAIWRHRTLGR